MSKVITFLGDQRGRLLKIFAAYSWKLQSEMLYLTSFPLSPQCWPRTWTSPPKNHFKTTLEETKTGVRALWSKLSVIDCSLLMEYFLQRWTIELVQISINMFLEYWNHTSFGNTDVVHVCWSYLKILNSSCLVLNIECRLVRKLISSDWD